MDKPIMMRQYNTTKFVVDSSFPALMQKLQEQQPGCDDWEKEQLFLEIWKKLRFICKKDIFPIGKIAILCYNVAG